jgi:predicted transcriptional regulator
MMDKLIDSGYVTKEKRSRKAIYSLTESGEYVACISGLLNRNIAINERSEVKIGYDS